VHELLQVCSALQPLLQPPELSIGFEMLTIAKSNVPPTSLVSAVFFRFFMEDFISLAQLAWKTFQIALVATGAHHQLTRDLWRLEREKSKHECLLSKTEDYRRQELASLVRGCRRYNAENLRIESCCDFVEFVTSSSEIA
jgi:hypothetical protein